MHFTKDTTMFVGQGKNKASEGVKTEFIYADGAREDVQLSGDWNEWKAIQMFHEGGGMWSVVTPVPPGAHEFKYIVDGEWKHSMRHPTIGIDEVSLNNVRYILAQPDAGNGTGSGAGAPGGKESKRGTRSEKAGRGKGERGLRARKSFGGLFSTSK